MHRCRMNKSTRKYFHKMLKKDLSTGAYKLNEKVKHEAEERSETINKIHQDVRNERREITSGYIEDKTRETLKVAEEKLEKLIDKIKE